MRKKNYYSESLKLFWKNKLAVLSLLIQVILNIAVVTNTIPNTGITLPFVSYGGTSVLFLLSEMGLALNVSRHVRQEP